MTEMLISSVTHEYLTPVRCINNFATLLTKTATKEQTNNVNLIINTSALLLSQINMTLDGNLIENGKFQPAPSITNLKALVQETLEIM